MNNKEMIQYEIIELNKRFINICLRVDESYLIELSNIKFEINRANLILSSLQLIMQ